MDSSIGQQARWPVIFTEYGLHFAKDGDHWRCVDWPELVMLCGERYQLNETTLVTGSLSLNGVENSYKGQSELSVILNPA
jgi:hypothetical protein